MSPRDVTTSSEDYLKAIYAIEDGGGAAGTNELAQRMGVGATSASHMMRKLAERGWASVEPYRGARLTEEGRRVALESKLLWLALASCSPVDSPSRHTGRATGQCA